MKTRIHFTILSQSLARASLLFAFCFCFAQVTQAQEQNCVADAEVARKACTTTDTSAGTTDGGAQMNQLSSGASQSNSSVSTIGSTQAAQLANQQALSQQLAQLASLKADACMNAMADCQLSCSNSAGFYKKLSQIYTNLGDSGQAQEASQSASGFGSSSGTCAGYSSNIQAASVQASQMMQNAGINQTGTADTSAVPSATADGGGSGSSGGGGTDIGFGAKLGDGGSSDASQFGNASSDDSGAGGVAGGSTRLASASAPDASAITGDQQTDSVSGADASGASNSGDRNIASTPAGASASGKAQTGSAGARGRRLLNTAINSIRGFRPWDKHSRSQEERRGLGRMSLQPVDGITGPMGPTIFEKVSRRYKLEAGELFND
jgi:hypothetical protein